MSRSSHVDTITSVDDTFMTDGVRYEVLNVLDVPEEMHSEYVAIWTVTPVALVEPR
jgi:hypothetical protein